MKAKRDTILIADDDPSLRQVLTVLLEEEGYAILHAKDGNECLRLAYEHHPDLVLLDIMMPQKDGRETCRQLRELSDTPIIMLTALSTDSEIVGRLQDGADDYVTKPFHNHELVARIRALLRRARFNRGLISHVYADDYMRIDFDTHQLAVHGRPVVLSPKEWRLLERLVAGQGKAVSREDLLHYAWGNEYQREFNYLKVFMSHLRRKLGDTPTQPRYIYTVRDVGYRFEQPKRVE